MTSLWGEGPLSVGFGEADLAAWIGHRMPGHELRTEPASALLDRLAVRSVVLRAAGLTVALVVADVIAIDSELEEQISCAAANAAGGGDPRVLVAATHTHTGPPVFALAGVDAFGLARRDLVAAATRATIDAVADLHTVSEIEIRRAGNPFAVNRRLPTPEGVVMQPNTHGAADKHVSLITFRAGEHAGGSICVLPMHPTVLAPRISGLSGDVPGAISSLLRTSGRFGALSLTVQGASGNVRPFITDEQGQFAGGGEEDVWRMARAITDALLRQEPQAAMIIEGFRYADRTVALHRVDASATGGVSKESAQVSAIMLGQRLGMVFLPGEPFAELAEEVGRRSPFEITLVAGHTGATVGYIPTLEASKEGGYEVSDGHEAYGFAGALAGDSAEILAAAAREVLSAV